MEMECGKKTSNFYQDDMLDDLVDGTQEVSDEDKRFNDYMFARDKTRKMIRDSKRCGYAKLIAYSLVGVR